MPNRSTEPVAAPASRYVGRFAPSPTGALHAGSLAAALASWLDARAHGGTWLVRIEDVDTPRCQAGADRLILEQLALHGLLADAPPVWQSTRTVHYETALATLQARGWAYPCACSRGDIELALQSSGKPRARHGELVYPGTCRGGLRGRRARAIRLLSTVTPQPPFEPLAVEWHDRRLAAQRQNVTDTVGDFVLKRSDGLWAYQLAVVVDDAAHGVTHIVRGEDLADNTPRQIHLQQVLDLPTPQYLHTPLVLGANGEKLSKQNGATPLDASQPVRALQQACAVLGLQSEAVGVADTLAQAVAQWRQRWLA
jgi:glutamyl-Q tRNA(Asp) synthetase